MIKLRKSAQPASLAKNALSWTEALIKLLDSGAVVPKSVWRRYAQQDVKDAAEKDTDGKCIYCESRITHVTYAHLEHLQPKSRFPRRTYDWTNLGLVCPKCNVMKGNRFEELMPPVNPFEERPSAFFIAYGELLWPVPGNDRARETIALTDLNRPPLLLQRRDRARQIEGLAETYVRCGSAAAKEALREQLIEELNGSHEYAFFARSIAVTLGVVSQESVDQMDP